MLYRKAFLPQVRLVSTRPLNYSRSSSRLLTFNFRMDACSSRMPSGPLAIPPDFFSSHSWTVCLVPTAAPLHALPYSGLVHARAPSQHPSAWLMFGFSITTPSHQLIPELRVIMLAVTSPLHPWAPPPHRGTPTSISIVLPFCSRVIGSAVMPSSRSTSLHT